MAYHIDAYEHMNTLCAIFVVLFVRLQEDERCDDTIAAEEGTTICNPRRG